MEYNQLTYSIRREHELIEQNQRERNEKFQKCIRSYTKHLQDEIEMVEKSLAGNEQRNQLINEGFETAYQRMLVGAEQVIRKMTNTFMEKRDFWKRVVEGHPEITSLDYKSSCYEHYFEKEEKYYEAIESQKVARVPYRVILGDRLDNKGLEIEQQKNKELEAHVTMTRKNSQDGWAGMSNTKPAQTQYNNQQDSIINEQVIGKFLKSNNNAPNGPRALPPRPASSRSRADKEESLLNEFLKK